MSRCTAEPHTGTTSRREGRNMTFLLAFTLGFLTGTAAGITGGILGAEHLRNRPRRAK